MTTQLDLLPPPQNEQEREDNAVIDRVLNHVENQAVLRALLAGKSFSEAVGICGGTHPYSWQADAKGILIHFGSEKERLIKPTQVMARARQYSQ